MYFLFDPIGYLTDVGDNVIGTMRHAFRSLMFSVDSVIYRLIIDLYNLFRSLCTGRLLNNEIMEQLSSRIGMILGLVMLFNVIFAFIQMLVDPDKITDKEKGAVSIIKKVLLVIVMLGLSNFAFNALYTIQRTVVESDVISKLLLPYTVSAGETATGNEKFGSVFSEELFYSFYQLETFDESLELSGDTLDVIDACTNTVNAFRNQIINTYRFDLGYTCLNETANVQMNNEDQAIFIVNFNGVLSVVVGVVVAYLLFRYCISVGIRMVQLMFLEIISPMAIVSFLSPKKDTMFSKWTKVYISTYIDVFIRMAIINFVFFLIATIFDASADSGFIFWETVGQPKNLYTKSFYVVIMVLALLTFAKKAPELLKELIPSGSSKLGFGVGLKDVVGLEKTAKIGTSIIGGAAGGAAIGLLSGSFGGAVGGLLKGGVSGFKGQGFMKTAGGAWKSEKDSIKKMRDIRANGGTWFGSHIARLQGALGIRNAYENDETNIANAQRYVEMYNEASKEAESEAIKNGARYRMQSFDGSANGHSLRELEMLKNDQTVNSGDREKYSLEYDQLLKSATQFNLDYGAAMENSTANFDSSGNLDYVRSSSGATFNSANIDSMSEANRAILIGSANAKINVNMKNVTGLDAGSGRGKVGKDKRNEQSTFITELKGSEQYNRNKTNAGK